MASYTASSPRTAYRCADAAAPPGARRAQAAERTLTPAPAELARAGLRLDLDRPAPGAATVTLSRPERRNAMTPGMWHGLAAIGRSLPPGVRVVVVRGEGPAIGAGFQLALACDLRVLADDARLSMREPTLGLVPDLLGTKPLVDIAGLPRALELCLTGRSVAAAEARELRLAELVVPVGELDATVGDLVAAILAL